MIAQSSSPLTHLSRTMDGLATREEAKEAVDSIAAMEKILSGSEWPMKPGSKSESLSEALHFWNVLAG